MRVPITRASRARKFEFCVRTTNCANPRQGTLTKEDYAKSKAGNYKKICKYCVEFSKWGSTHCSKGSECEHPRQGRLTKVEFSYGRSVCDRCTKAFSYDDIINSSMAQQWLCGRIGHETRA